MRISPRRTTRTCPFCREVLGECVACRACRTWLHEDCHRENEGCTTLGCPEARSKSALVIRRRARRSSSIFFRPTIAAITATGLASFAGQLVELVVRVVVFLLALRPHALTSHVVSTVWRHPHTTLDMKLGIATAAVVFVASLAWSSRARPPRTTFTRRDFVKVLLCGFSTGCFGAALFHSTIEVFFVDVRY